MSGHVKIRDAKVHARLRRKGSIRKRIRGSAERPRLSVFRSLKHIYAQVIDDDTNVVLAAASDQEKALAASLSGKKKAERAEVVGEELAKRLLAKQITRVVFDRNGFIYHGRVKAVADGARKAGLEF